MHKKCCFTGPRPKNFPWRSEDERYIRPLKERLEKEIRKAIKSGYRQFISGMAIGVDMYAAQIVLKIKEEQPVLGITLIAALPFPQQANNWTVAQTEEWSRILSKADKCVTIGQAHSVENFNKRDEYMVDNASLVIAVKPVRPGGTQRTIDYANKLKKEVILIDPMEYFK